MKTKPQKKDPSTHFTSHPCFRVARTLVLALLVQTHHAQANIGDALGFGAKTRSFSGATVSGGADAFSAYHNPAAIGVSSDRRLLFSYGLLWANPSFLPIQNVAIQNRYNSDQASGNPTYGNIDLSVRPTFGQELGFSYRLFADRSTLNLGIVSFIPLDQLAMFDTGEPLQPEYVLYRARTQRPQVNVGLGSELGAGLHIGLGLGFDFSITSQAEAFLTGSASTASSMKFAASVKPSVRPYFGLFYSPQSSPQSFTLGAVVRLASATKNLMVLKTRARALGGVAALDLNFNGRSALYYDPMTLELGGSFPMASWGRLYTQVDWQLWNGFEAPALFIEEPPQANNLFHLRPGGSPAQSYTRILIPRMAQEIYLSDTTTVRLGYAYRPSFLSSPTQAAGNYLDPSKHILNLGLGLQYSHFLSLEVPMSVDFHFTYHSLIRQTIVKTPGNEGGDLTDVKIGHPGYNAGGSLLGVGVNISFAI
jgi:hypothetical protein